MAVDSTAYRPLFGGAISTIFPIRFQVFFNSFPIFLFNFCPQFFFLIYFLINFVKVLTINAYLNFMRFAGCQ